MKKALIAVFAVILILGAGLFVGSKFVFFPNATIDCGEFVVEAGLRKNSDIAKDIKTKFDEIKYSIVESDGTEHQLSMKECNREVLTVEIENAVAGLKKGIFKTDYTLDLTPFIKIESQTISSLITTINSEKESEQTEPEEAHIEYNEEKRKFVLVEGKAGNAIVIEGYDKIIAEMQKLNRRILLNDLGCYKAPTISVNNNEELLLDLNEYEDYNKYKLTYKFGDKEEVIDVTVFHDWLELADKEVNIEADYGIFNIREDKIAEYVDELDYKYSTVGTIRDFSTSTDEIVAVTNGNYGWILDKETMKTEIRELLGNKISIKKDATFIQEAECFGERDFGNSYIEISIKNQHLWMYVDGEMVMDSPVVTGNVEKKLDTPIGIYKAMDKKRGEDLVCSEDGKNVSYWFPFNEEIGMHDADWRNNFGENIYETNGSNGCVELPLATAKFIFENFDISMPIIVY